MKNIAITLALLFGSLLWGQSIFQLEDKQLEIKLPDLYETINEDSFTESGDYMLFHVQNPDEDGALNYINMTYLYTDSDPMPFELTSEIFKVNLEDNFKNLEFLSEQKFWIDSQTINGNLFSAIQGSAKITELDRMMHILFLLKEFNGNILMIHCSYDNEDDKNLIDASVQSLQIK